MIDQTSFGAAFGSPWNPVRPDLHDYRQPDRSRPALDGWPVPISGDGRSVVTVLGTVRDERVPLSRSLEIWSRQRLPEWLTVLYLVLDDGSADDPEEECRVWADRGLPIRYARMRGSGGPDRSCTLAFNAAVRFLVSSPLVMFQWWDRIPGSFDHLRLLCEPHRTEAGILTSAVSRHIGGSSSLIGMTPDQLSATINLVDWRSDPSRLARVAGPIGQHCIPGRATESSGCIWPVPEFLALGGYDERYDQRAGYANVELFRRTIQAGLVVRFVPEPSGANYHQSHAAGREKSWGWLDDPAVRRNPDGRWGATPIEYAWPE